MPPWRETAALGVALRPMRDDDLPFTATLYASTREEELAPVPWPPETKQAFLAQQHAAQHAHYRQHYQGMEAMIVERPAGAAIGRLYLFESQQEIRIVDVSLMPAARGGGIGGALLRDVQADAAARGKSVTIHVEKNNPARTLYMRLGFTVLDVDRGAYDLMGWRPD